MRALTSGSLAKGAGVDPEAIRFFERQGLLTEPPRTQSGYRLFPRDAVRRVRFIRRAQELGFTPREKRELLDLRVNSETTCRQVRERADAKIAEVGEKIRSLETISRRCSGSPRSPPAADRSANARSSKPWTRRSQMKVELIYDAQRPSVAETPLMLLKAAPHGLTIPPLGSRNPQRWGVTMRSPLTSAS